MLGCKLPDRSIHLRSLKQKTTIPYLIVLGTRERLNQRLNLWEVNERKGSKSADRASGQAESVILSQSKRWTSVEDTGWERETCEWITTDEHVALKDCVCAEARETTGTGTARHQGRCPGPGGRTGLAGDAASSPTLWPNSSPACLMGEETGANSANGQDRAALSGTCRGERILHSSHYGTRAWETLKEFFVHHIKFWVEKALLIQLCTGARTHWVWFGF